ncbi:MAG: SDR family oxidoreductase [Candidatus Aminicenantes bacterium]|nr:SDR family oxidoreductase [Candidatus Aminicenantes bacterium]
MALFLVTGGAGFIGSHLVEKLISLGEKVRVLDNFLTGKRENLAPYLGKIDLIEGDIRDLEVCRRACEGVNYVFHQAALPSVARSVEDPKTTSEINIEGTLNLLLSAQKCGVKRFVFASSSSVYGDDESLPKREGLEGRPLSPYALSKRTGEEYCRLFYQLYGLSTVCLRYFNVFGPRQDPLSPYAAVIPNFIFRLLQGKEPIIFGDGEQSRDFTYVANVVEANLLTIKADDRISGEVFNIACGQQISVNTLVTELNRLLGTQIKSIHAEPRPGDIRHSLADISKARRILGFEPRYSFEAGLAHTLNWFKKRMGHETQNKVFY